MKLIRSSCFAVLLIGAASGVCPAWGQGAAQPSTPDNLVPPRLIKRVDPAYAGIPFTERADGDVIMRATIGADGTVKKIKVTQGLPPLIGPAVHAVSQWQYEPARANGVATATTIVITVPFRFFTDNGATTPASQVDANAIANAPLPAPKGALPPPPAGIMRISGRMMATMLDKKVDPVYPQDAVALDARGTVVLLATIKKTGEVGEVQVVSGPQRFQEAAVNAVKQWHYRPYLVDGQPAEVQTTIALDFAPPAH